MAAPRLLSIIPDCKLNIELVEKSRIIDYTDSSLPWEYRIKSDIEMAGERLDKFVGRLSPIAKVTIEKEDREAAGIPQTAETFAFMYPLEGLINALKGKGIRNDLMDWYSSEDKKLSAVYMGGFVYFDKDLECIGVNAVYMGGFVYVDNDLKRIGGNALSKNTSQNNIPFAGPFEVNESACTELFKVKASANRNTSCCVQSVLLDNFREAGFVKFAWVRPEETFNFKPIFADHNNMDGALVYFREDGTGVGYAVDPMAIEMDTGYSGMLSNVFGYDGGHVSSECQNDITSMNDVKAWKKDNEHLLRCSDCCGVDVIELKGTSVELSSSDVVVVDIVKLESTLGDKTKLLHRACHANLGFGFIKLLLDRKGSDVINELKHQQGVGWTPLHYACCFSPTNSALIELLVNTCPEAVQIKDNYGRYPLHIACNGGASANVITRLLDADMSDEMISLTATPSFGLSPIHLACYQGAASEHILEALLLQNNTGMTSRKTVRDQLPLHLAILEKLSPQTVKMLLDADSKYQVKILLEADSKYQSTPPRLIPDVRMLFDQRLPLHWACWNNLPCEIVESLLEKDENKMTSYQPAGHITRPEELIDGDNSNLSMSADDNSSLLESDLSVANSVASRNIGDIIDQGQVRHCQQSKDGIALHLALKHGRRKTIGLLLQEEMKGMNYENKSSIVRTDDSGRIPLHIACKYSMDPQVIQVLLKLDQMKVTPHVLDNAGCSPLHYACKNESVSLEAIDLLLDAKAKDKTRTNKDNTVDRDLLYLAVRANAPDAVIGRLLQPEIFSLAAFDEDASSALAVRILKSKAIQEQILIIMSDRFIFFTLVLEFAANIIAMVLLFTATFMLLEKKSTQEEIVPYAAGLLVCTLVFIFREVVDYKSVGEQYLHDIWNLNEWLTILFLLVVIHYFFVDIEGKKDEVLCITGSLLIIQFIFFLRSTVQPFARFVGGLLKIVKRLLPLLFISCLLLLGFMYTYWILNEGCGDCVENCSFENCIEYVFGQIHDFQLGEEDTDFRVNSTQLLGVVFGLFFILILLSVVIALVDDIWNSTEDEAIQFLWESRVQKISQVQYAISKRNRHLPVKFPILKFIDNLHNISYESDVSWTKAPYDQVTKRDHYMNPDAFFDTDLARKIWKTKSLQADLYWAKQDKKKNEGTWKFLDTLIIFVNWVGQCILYLSLIIIGIASFGVLLPEAFRKGVLSVNYSDRRNYSRKQLRHMADAQHEEMLKYK